MNYVWELTCEIWRPRSPTMYQQQVEEQSGFQYVRTLGRGVAGVVSESEDPQLGDLMSERKKVNVLAPEEKGIQEPAEESQKNFSASFLLLLYPYISLPCSHPFFPSVVNGTCLQKLGKEVLPEGLSHTRSEDKQTGRLADLGSLTGRFQDMCCHSISSGFHLRSSFISCYVSQRYGS